MLSLNMIQNMVSSSGFIMANLTREQILGYFVQVELDILETFQMKETYKGSLLIRYVLVFPIFMRS